MASSKTTNGTTQGEQQPRLSRSGSGLGASSSSRSEGGQGLRLPSILRTSENQRKQTQSVHTEASSSFCSSSAFAPSYKESLSLHGSSATENQTNNVARSAKQGRQRLPLLAAPFLTDMTGAVNSSLIQSQLAHLLVELSSASSAPNGLITNEQQSSTDEKEEAVESIKQTTAGDYAEASVNFVPDEQEEQQVLECMASSLREIAYRAMDNTMRRETPEQLQQYQQGTHASSLLNLLADRKTEADLSKAARLTVPQAQLLSSGGTPDTLPCAHISADSPPEEIEQLVNVISDYAKYSHSSTKDLLFRNGKATYEYAANFAKEASSAPNLGGKRAQLPQSQETTHSAFGRVGSGGQGMAHLVESQYSHFDVDEIEAPSDHDMQSLHPSQSSFNSFTAPRNTLVDPTINEVDESQRFSQSQRSGLPRFDSIIDPSDAHGDDLSANIEEDYNLHLMNSPGANNASERANVVSPSVYEAASMLRSQQQRTPHGLTPTGGLSASSSGERRKQYNGYSSSPDNAEHVSHRYQFEDASGSSLSQERSHKKKNTKKQASTSKKRPKQKIQTESADDSESSKRPAKKLKKEGKTKAKSSEDSEGKGEDDRKVSRYLGVSWIRATEKWRADSVVNGKLQYLGCYDTEKEAAQAVDRARVGGWDGRSKIRLNFPEEHPHVTTAYPAVKQARGTSKFVGVSWDLKLKKWKARIVLDGRHERIGLFDSEEEAARAVDKSKVENWDGSTMPRLNFPGEYDLPHGKGSQAALVKTAVEHGLNAPKVRGKKNQRSVEETATSPCVNSPQKSPTKGRPKRSRRQARQRRKTDSGSQEESGDDEFAHDTSE